MKLSQLPLTYKTLIQLVLAAVIALLFQFVFPLRWQPLDVYLKGPDIHHGDEGTNFVIATLSLWYFALSLTWFLFRKNPIINNYLVYAIVPLSMIVFAEFFIYQLFYDYVHLLPVVVSILIMWKKRHTLDQRYVVPYLSMITVWFFSVHFLELAYYDVSFFVVFCNWAVSSAIAVALSFLFRKRSLHISEPSSEGSFS